MDFFDLITDTANMAAGSAELLELKTTDEPVLFSFMPFHNEAVQDHYCNLDGLDGYIFCPDDESCLLCRLKMGMPVVNRSVYPVFNHETLAIEALPVRERSGPQSLSAKINIIYHTAIIEDSIPSLYEKVFQISRHGKEITLKKYGTMPDALKAEVSGRLTTFKENYQKGDLGNAVHTVMSWDDLLLIPDIRHKAVRKGIRVPELPFE